MAAAVIYVALSDTDSMCLKIMSLTGILLLLACQTSTAHRPKPSGIDKAENGCAGIDRALTESEKAELAPAFSKQLHVTSVAVFPQSFRADDWSIFYVDTHGSDPTFLFYSGNPLSSHFVAQWSGATMNNEDAEIKAWTLKNAPHIPLRLASCFAWYVTHAR